MAESSSLPGWLVAINLWTLGLLAVAVLADVLLARRVRPAWRILVYVPVLVRVAIPVAWHSPVAPIGWIAADEVAPAAGGGAPAFWALPLVSPSMTEPASEPVAAAGVDGLGLVVLLVWITGALVLLGGLARAHRRLHAALAVSTPARERAARFARAVPMREHPWLGPLTLGVLRPVVLVPRGLVDALEDRELACVVAHELAHVHRRDGALALGLALASAMLWPIVAVRVAAARVRRLMELAADDLAIDRSRAGGIESYGRTLVRLATEPMSSSSTALGIGGYRDLRGRLAALSEPCRPRAVVQLGLVAVATAGPLACAGVDEDPEGLARRCDTVEQLATIAHDAAEKTRHPALYAAASQSYEEYAADCADDPDYEEIMYYRAELLWAVAFHATNAGEDPRSPYDAAHDAFLEVLDARPGRYTKDAAYAQMLATRNALEVDFPEPTLRPRPTPEARANAPEPAPFVRSEYDDDERELLASYDTYERWISDAADPDLQKVLHHRAKLAMDHHRFDEVVPPLERLLAHDGDTAWHVHGAAMLLDVHTIALADATATAEARARAAARLAELCDRLPTLALWSREDAAPVRAAVQALR